MFKTDMAAVNSVKMTGIKIMSNFPTKNRVIDVDVFSADSQV